MAGDWLKVEKVTPDKPEMRQIARQCGCTRGDAFAAWFRLWSYFDVTTANGEVPFFGADDADEEARLPGIGEALADAGWLVFHPGGCTIVNWDRHNGENAKQRALAHERKRKQRRSSG